MLTVGNGTKYGKPCDKSMTRGQLNSSSGTGVVAGAQYDYHQKVLHEQLGIPFHRHITSYSLHIGAGSIPEVTVVYLLPNLPKP